MPNDSFNRYAAASRARFGQAQVRHVVLERTVNVVQCFEQVTDE